LEEVAVAAPEAEAAEAGAAPGGKEDKASEE